MKNNSICKIYTFASFTIIIFNGAAHSSSAHSGYTPRFHSTLPIHRFAIAGHTMLSQGHCLNNWKLSPEKKVLWALQALLLLGVGMQDPFCPFGDSSPVSSWPNQSVLPYPEPQASFMCSKWSLASLTDFGCGPRPSSAKTS